MAILRPPEPISRRSDNFYAPTKYMSWWLWCDGDTEYPIPCADEGWKLHIGGRKDNAKRILDAVAPVLQERGVFHKVTRDLGRFTTATGNQVGKWFVAYPWSVLQAFEIVHEIDRQIDRIYPDSDRDELTVEIPGEKKVGRTIVYARYGQFRDGDWVLDGRGGRVADIRGRERPDHIRDYWDSHYVAIGSGMPRAEWPREIREPFPIYTAAQREAVTASE